MDSFKRVFKYVFPQWPRVIVVVVSAVVVAALMSLSVISAIPAIKVMISDEGLHGWSYRKVCGYRYGMKFEVPKKTDYETTDIAFYLLVTDVKDDGLAEKAGLVEQDRIIGAGEFLVDDTGERIGSSKLLEQLAVSEGGKLTLQVARFDEAGNQVIKDVEL